MWNNHERRVPRTLTATNLPLRHIAGDEAEYFSAINPVVALTLGIGSVFLIVLAMSAAALLLL